MTVLIARLKQAAKWIGAIIMFSVLASIALFRKRRQDPLDRAIDRYDRQTAEASARAAVEIAVARTRRGEERERLLDILRDEDEERQVDRLIDEAKRLRGE